MNLEKFKELAEDAYILLMIARVLEETSPENHIEILLQAVVTARKENMILEKHLIELNRYITTRGDGWGD